MADNQNSSTDSQETATFDVDSGAAAIFGLLSTDDLSKAQDVEQDEGDESADDTADDASDDAQEDEGDAEGDESEDADDDVEADEATDDTDDPPATYKVKVDGTEVEVTLDEALKGYQRQQAFTRKTQALAEERKALQETATEIAQKRQEYLDKLSVVTVALKGGAQEPNWEQLKRENPAAYADQRIAWQERREQIEAIEAEQRRVRDDMQKAMKAEQNQALALEAERLEAAIPEWAADPDKAASDKQRLAEFAQTTYGFTPQDLGNVVDHRLILLLRDAMLSHEQRARSAKAKDALKGTRKKSPTLPPGTPAKRSAQSKKGSPALARLKQSGSVQDAAAALFDMLE